MRLQEFNKMYEKISGFENLNYILIVSIISFVFAVVLGFIIDFIKNGGSKGSSKSGFDNFNFIIFTSIISFMLASVLGFTIILMKEEGFVRSSIFIILIICFAISSLIYMIKEKLPLKLQQR